MTTNPARSKCLTTRSATIAAMYLSESWTGFLPLNSSAKAKGLAFGSNWSVCVHGRGALRRLGRPKPLKIVRIRGSRQ
jgi:hypothetical protein